MSKELPEGLRPVPVARTAQEAMARAVNAMAKNVVDNQPWILLALDQADGCEMFGTVKTEWQARSFVISAVESWSMVAAAVGDEKSGAMAKLIMNLLGAKTEYVYGGLVPAKK